MAKRLRQARYWMYETINESLRSDFYDNASIQEMLRKCEEGVTLNEMTSFEAARRALELYETIRHK